MTEKKWKPDSQEQIGAYLAETSGIGKLKEMLWSWKYLQHPIARAAFWAQLAELCRVEAVQQQLKNDEIGVPD